MFDTNLKHIKQESEELRMLETYTELKEKVEWLNSFLLQSYTIHTKTGELLLEAISIPRNASWNSPLITKLIENTEKKQKEVEDLITVYEMTILKDLKSLTNKIDIKIDQYNRERQKFHDNLRGLKQSFEVKRMQYVDSLCTNKIDSWFCAVEFVNRLKIYLREREKNEQDYRLRVGTKDSKFYELLEHYNSIIANYLKIEQIHSGKLTSLYNIDIYPEIDQMGSDNVDMNDEFETNFASKLDNEKHESYYDKEYYRETKDVPDLECTINNSVIKYGIYKTKRLNQSTWHPSFVVYTKGHFLHVFELNTIIKSNKNLKIKYCDIIARINAQPTKKLLFFAHKDVPQLDMNEESDLLEFSKAIYNNFDFLCQEDIRHSSYIPNKTVRFNKELYEIVIESRSIGSFSNLFSPSVTKIKSYLLKDIYELYFGFNNKLVNIMQTAEKGTLVDTNDAILDDLKRPDTTTQWANIKEDNPWENI